MRRVRRVGRFFLAKLLAIIMGCFGLLTGVVYALGGAAHDLLTTRPVNAGTALAFLAI